MSPGFPSAALLALALIAPQALHAQGVASVALKGAVRVADGSESEGTRVVVRNESTGFVVEAEAVRGRFFLQGLEPGGPYTITVVRIGATARRWERVYLTLGRPLELNVVLDPAPVTLDSVTVVADALSSLSCCDGGLATTLNDSLVHHLPSLNRNVYDFVRLVPQISTRIGFANGGISGGGIGFRFNGFLTNGVPERSLAGGQPPEFAGGRSLPFDAVRDYQVLVAPFDPRYGDFAGALVNTVTRSGTNRWQGSVFGSGRNDDLARRGMAASPYDRWQYGVSVSGPVVRDRLHFLLASEVQRQDAPMTGPYVGQPATAGAVLPVFEADLARLESVLRQYGLEAGTGGAVENRSRITSHFARVDAALPELASRAVLWVNDGDTRSLGFSRAAGDSTFELSSVSAETVFGTRTIALQLSSALRRDGGAHNALSVSRRTIPFRGVPAVQQPIVRVAVPAPNGGRTTVVTGTPPPVAGRRDPQLGRERTRRPDLAARLLARSEPRRGSGVVPARAGKTSELVRHLDVRRSGFAGRRTRRAL